MLGLLIIGSITAVISSLAGFIANALFKKKKRVELYSMPFEYTKSPRGSRVWISRCVMLFRREVVKEQLNVNVNPLEDWMDLLSRQSRHESAASWEASCSAAGHRLGVRRMNEWKYSVRLLALLREFV